MKKLPSETLCLLLEDALEFANEIDTEAALKGLCGCMERACDIWSVQVEIQIDGTVYSSGEWNANEDAASRLVPLFVDGRQRGIARWHANKDTGEQVDPAEIDHAVQWTLRAFYEHKRTHSLESHNAALRELVRTSSAVAAGKSFDSAIRSMLNLVTRQFGAIIAAAWMYDPVSLTLTMRYSSDGYLESYLGWTLPVDRVGPYSGVLLENRSFVTPNYLAWLAENPDIAQALAPSHNPEADIAALLPNKGASDVTLLGIPLTGTDGLIGVIVLMFDELPNELRDPRSVFLSAVGEIVAGALESVKRQESLSNSENHLVVELDERNRLLEETSRRLRRAAEANARIQEAERDDIARELHDTTSQIFTGLSFKLRSLLDSPVLAGTREHDELAQIGKLVADIHSQQRNIVEMLDPSLLRKKGLVVAVSNLLTPYLADDSIEWGFEVRGDTRRLDPQVEKAIYRIVGEAVSNAVAYSKAHAIKIVLDWKLAYLEVSVTDDGSGFDKDELFSDGRAHHGIANMQDRALLAGAQFELRSAPGAGTTVRLIVPYDVEADIS